VKQNRAERARKRVAERGGERREEKEFVSFCSLRPVCYIFRVNSLGDFLPMYWMTVSLVKVCSITGVVPNFYYFSSTTKVTYCLILTNNGLGYSLGDFFTVSSGHPVCYCFGKDGVNCAAAPNRLYNCAKCSGRHTRSKGGRCCDFKNIFDENLGEKMAIF
jgi:hypothetical protein